MEQQLEGVAAAEGRRRAAAVVAEIPGVGQEAAAQVAAYLAASREALGALPTCQRIVIERANGP